MLEPILGAAAGGVGFGACVTGAAGVLETGFAEVRVLIFVDGLESASFAGFEDDASTREVLISAC